MSKPQINIFVPCFIDQLYPQTAVNFVRLLRALGYEVNYNPNQTCCGQPAFNAGFMDEARRVAQKMLVDLAALPAVPTLCLSSSCVGFSQKQVPNLCGESCTDEVCIAPIPLLECSSFLVNEIGLARLAQIIKPKLVARATYHDACSALRDCGVKSAPRQLLALVEGLELIESRDAERCCGFGGSFAAKFEPISVAMAEQKIESALKINAEYIISADWSCLMQLQGYIDKKKYAIKTIHLIDVLAGFIS
jgi:L-lactate dehydrogenase complex protein LldE